MNEELMHDTPQFQHVDCPACEFLGIKAFSIKDQRDVYICKAGDDPRWWSFILRRSSAGSDYSSAPLGVLFGTGYATKLADVAREFVRPTAFEVLRRL